MVDSIQATQRLLFTMPPRTLKPRRNAHLCLTCITLLMNELDCRTLLEKCVMQRCLPMRIDTHKLYNHANLDAD